MAQPQQGFYLFFSNQCPHSQRILQRLRGHPVMNVLTLVCIDDPRIQIPPFIDAVPALFLQQQKQLLKDNNLIAWVEQMVGGGGNGRPQQQMQQQMQMRQGMQQQAMQQQPMPQPNRGNMPGPMMAPPSQASNFVNMADITGDATISAFQASEMLSGAGTSYSFIDDSANEQLAHNYGFLDDRDTSKLPAITRHEGTGVSGGGSSMQQANPMASPSGKGKGLKGAGMDKDYERLMQQRNADIPSPMNNMRF